MQYLDSIFIVYIFQISLPYRGMYQNRFRVRDAAQEPEVALASHGSFEGSLQTILTSTSKQIS